MAAGNGKVVVVGGGPVGCVLSLLLARRGFEVEVYEARPDMRRRDVPAGRSINLVLCNRGLRALRLLELEEPVLALTVPVYGRMMHALDGALAYQPYGKDETERNYSVPRGGLNAFLLDQAEAAGARLRFDAKVVAVDLDAGRLELDAPGGREAVEAPVVIGCDGAPSAVREALCARPGFARTSDLLAWGYKELTFPPGAGGAFAMDRRALHIWPRGHHFLMGLPNQDGSFTGTVYLPWEGDDSFAAVEAPGAARAFFERVYPDAVPLLPDLEADWADNPASHLGTIRCGPWHLDGRALVLGDAAHAIVPFFGQGLNCGFEDCAVLDELLAARGADLEAVFAAVTARRKTNTDAIADMALENFVEMRDKVGDPAFLLRKQVEARLDRELSAKYRSRYAMVMYSAIPYRDAYDAGEVQAEVLDALCAGISAPSEVDLARAEALIDERLTPLLAERGVDLDF